MFSSAQFSPSQEIIYDNCRFDLVENEQNDTVYLTTHDPNFILPEGYAVGSKWSSLIPEHQAKLERMSGWGYYIQLESGWQIGFCEGQSCTDSAPTVDSVVKWIFRRNN